MILAILIVGSVSFSRLSSKFSHTKINIKISKSKDKLIIKITFKYQISDKLIYSKCLGLFQSNSIFTFSFGNTNFILLMKAPIYTFLKTGFQDKFTNQIIEASCIMKDLLERYDNPLKILATTYGIIVGLTAILHGFFETLQGNLQTNNTLIEAIGPNQKFWEYGTLHAVSFAPTYLIAGILAISMGIFVIIWSMLFLDRKFGGIAFFLLILITFLVGGGYGVPISIGILGTLASFWLNKPNLIIKNHVSLKYQIFFQKLWPESLIFFIIVFIGSTTLSIIGWPLVELIGAQTTLTVVWVLALLMIILMIFAFCNAFLISVDNQDTEIAK